MNKPNLATPLQHINPRDQQAAVAILAGLTIKNKGGKRLAQEYAAWKSSQLLSAGHTASNAIELAAKAAMELYPVKYANGVSLIEHPKRIAIA